MTENEEVNLHPDGPNPVTRREDRLPRYPSDKLAELEIDNDLLAEHVERLRAHTAKMKDMLSVVDRSGLLKLDFTNHTISFSDAVTGSLLQIISSLEPENPAVSAPDPPHLTNFLGSIISYLQQQNQRKVSDLLIRRDAERLASENESPHTLIEDLKIRLDAADSRANKVPELENWSESLSSKLLSEKTQLATAKKSLDSSREQLQDCKRALAQSNQRLATVSQEAFERISNLALAHSHEISAHRDAHEKASSSLREQLELSSRLHSDNLQSTLDSANQTISQLRVELEDIRNARDLLSLDLKSQRRAADQYRIAAEIAESRCTDLILTNTDQKAKLEQTGATLQERSIQLSQAQAKTLDDSHVLAINRAEIDNLRLQRDRRSSNLTELERLKVVSAQREIEIRSLQEANALLLAETVELKKTMTTDSDRTASENEQEVANGIQAGVHSFSRSPTPTSQQVEMDVDIPNTNDRHSDTGLKALRTPINDVVIFSSRESPLMIGRNLKKRLSKATQQKKTNEAERAAKRRAGILPPLKKRNRISQLEELLNDSKLLLSEHGLEGKGCSRRSERRRHEYK